MSSSLVRNVDLEMIRVRMENLLLLDDKRKSKEPAN